ncbi:MAG: hypothetical protein E7316_08750 [Clostridiales bacterium]|nr:hypothetical protein [Clostridiales bacterium]
MAFLPLRNRISLWSCFHADEVILAAGVVDMAAVARHGAAPFISLVYYTTQEQKRTAARVISHESFIYRAACGGLSIMLNYTYFINE